MPEVSTNNLSTIRGSLRNDRGTAIAAAELALMAGAERVEGTLFGNGERTGNVDLVTLALNLYTQGIDPHLDFSNLNEVVNTVEYCNQIPVHQRHPYAGELVFTAFSGSHQDAIRKGFASQQASHVWRVPYLSIDPADIGRTYEEIIRINSQSGKGGIAYILEKDHGLCLPPLLQVEFRKVVQKIADEHCQELTSDDIWKLFEKEYLKIAGPYKLIDYWERQNNEHICELTAHITIDGEMKTLNSTGQGPIDAFVEALCRATGLNLKILDYHEHAGGSGSDAIAIAYVCVTAGNGTALFGVGRDTSIVAASLQAVVSAVNRLMLLQYE